MTDYPNWNCAPLFIIKEVENLILQLANDDKAPGENGAPGEVFKYNLTQWTPVIVRLLDSVHLESCSSPDWNLTPRIFQEEDWSLQ